MSSPKFEDFRKIENSNTNPGYLFDGPANVLGEGGPVPVGYGRMKVGSQTIELSINNKEFRVTASSQEIKETLFENENE
jgi:predicted phage tail protein